MIQLQQEYDYDQIYREFMELGQRYSGFVEFRIIGLSHDERKIPMLQIGRAKQVLFCTAGIHGRERTNPILLLKMAEDYCMAYEAGWTVQNLYSVRKLLDHISICLIPLVNPDGYEIASKGYESIRNPIYRQMLKMKQIPSEQWKGNARGIDINRNFPCSSYRRQGIQENPASENETKAVIRIMQEKESIGYLDFHSRGRIIYYYRNAMSPFFNQKSGKIARNMQRLNHYRIGGSREELKTEWDGGNSVQYYAESHRHPALTIETVDERKSFPLLPEEQKKAYLEIYPLPLEYIFTTLNPR